MKTLTAAIAGLAFFAATPAFAAETIDVPFTTPDGGQTTNTYSGVVKVTVSGTGFSAGARLNDAFYLLDPVEHDPSYYQLTFGTTTLTPLNPAQNAVNFVVGGLPAFSANHIYSFLLDTGTATPSILHFGVGDGGFGDNGGAFSVSVAGVPEPATWGLMILGFGAVGGALRRRSAVRTSVSYA